MVLFLVGIVDRLEASVISGVLPQIQAEWGVSDTLAGAIPTAAAIAGAIVVLPAGYVADRYNRTAVIAVVVALWSIITLGSAAALGFAMFFATRVLLGAAENIDNPAGSSLLADYYPPLTRAKVFGWVRLTHYAGMALGVMVGGVVGQFFGWRGAFLFMVVPGLVVAVLCWRLREPARGFLDRVVARGSDERVPVPNGPGSGARADAAGLRSRMRGLDFRGQIREVSAIPTLRLVSLGLTALTLGLGGIFYWMASLFQRGFGLEPGPAGLFSGMIGLIGVVGGAVFGGWLGGRWHGTRPGGRILAGGGGLLLGSLLLGCTLAVDDLLLFSLGLLASNFLSAIAIPNLMACIADVIGAASRGIGFAGLQFLIVLGAAAGPLVVGAVSDAMGSLLGAMYALIVPMLIGAVLVLWARRHFEADAGRVLDRARSETAE
ncbi:MFS transporter [Spinactinospora alkalitolerans]